MMRLRDNWWGRYLLCSPSTTQHNLCFLEIRIFENCMSKQILKLTNMYLFWQWWVWEIIDEEDIYCACLAQLSTTQHNLCLFGIRIFENCMSKQILKLTNMYLFWQWWVWEIIDEEDIYCARLAQLSTTQHNLCFFEIRIFENCMSKQILKLTNMYLFWKRCVSERIDEEDIYCARLAQLSATFVFSKFAFLKIVCLNKFWNWQICIYFENDAFQRKLMRKIFIVLA